MKKIIICLLMSILTTGLVFSNGNFEVSGLQLDSTSANPVEWGCTYRLEESFGVARVRMQFQHQGNPGDPQFLDGVKFVFLKVRDDEYYNISSDLSILDFTGKILFNQLSPVASNGNKEFTIASANAGGWPFMQTVHRYHSGTCPGLANMTMDEFSKDGIEIPIFYFDESEPYEVLIIKDDDSYEWFKFDSSLEFFEGEGELFEQVEDLSYKQKAAIFLRTFITAPEDRIEYESILPICFNNELTIQPEDWDVFNNLEEVNLEPYKSRLKRSFTRHMQYAADKNFKDGQEYLFPYLDLDSTDFNQVYGSYRNVYMLLYLYYNYHMRKPLFSYIYKETLSNAENQDLNINYNYRQYKRLDELQTSYLNEDVTLGSKFSKIALRYLSWGLEYTPFSGSNSHLLNPARNHVFHPLYMNNINDWMSSTANRENNYLPVEPYMLDSGLNDPQFSQVPAKIQVLNRDVHFKDFQLVGKLSGIGLPSIARIDVWTSRNIAWDDGRIEGYINNFAGNQNLSEENGNNLGLLRDKRISHDDAGGNNFDNLHVIRNGPPVDVNYVVDDNDEDRIANNNYTRNIFPGNIEIGYKFTDYEKISAVCIARGAAAPKQAVLGGYYNYIDVVNFRIKHLVDGVEQVETFEGKRLSGTKFYEFVSVARDDPDTWNDNYDYDRYGIRERLPGFGVLSDYYSRNGQYIVFNYFIFKKPIDNCKEIVFIDKTGNEYLNISELMVFPENPLDYKPVSSPGGAYLNYQDYLSVYSTAPGLNGNSLNALKNADFNNGVAAGRTLNDNLYVIDISLEEAYPVDSIVVWEEDGDASVSSEYFSNGLQIFQGAFTLDEDTQNIMSAEPDNYFEALSGLSTPFWNQIIELNLPIALNPDDYIQEGNPLPYAPFGIDSPRTFNYKMYEQYKAKDGYKNIIINKNAAITAAADAATAASDAAAAAEAAAGSANITDAEAAAADAVAAALEADNAAGIAAAAVAATANPAAVSIAAANAAAAASTAANNASAAAAGVVAALTADPADPAAVTAAAEAAAAAAVAAGIAAENAYAAANPAHLMPGPSFSNTPSTRALDSTGIEDFFTAYIDEMELFRVMDNPVNLKINKTDFKYMPGTYPANNPQKTLNGQATTYKPFLPGFLFENNEGCINSYDSLYSPDKSAGVDSLGLLSGTISMSGYDEVRDSFNRKLGAILDGYYGMKPAVTEVDSVNLTGRDVNGKPVFNPGGNNSFLNTPYRLTRADIERNTVLVPDIKLIEEGDLLVNYNINGQPHIGIVAGFLSDKPVEYNTDIREFWDKVLVLSIRRGVRTVTIGTWGNPGGVFGGFTLDPEVYHIRRLLSFSEENVEAGVKDSWEMLDDIIAKIECSVVLPNDDYIAPGAGDYFPYHWIPNPDPNNPDPNNPDMDFVLKDIQVRVRAFDFNNQLVQAIPLDDNHVKILPPEDPYFNLVNARDSESSNHTSNKGNGLKLYVYRKRIVDGQIFYDTFWLADFVRKGYNEFLTKDTYYDVVYNPQYFMDDNSGMTADGYTLNIVNGIIQFIDNENNIVADKFALTPSNTVRFGDDFLLRFGLVGNDLIVQTDPDDFVAVIDKLLLDRAHLYIDEGAGDWNGEDQIDISPWTRFSDNLHISISVAYSKGCADSVDDFNNDLEEQKNTIRAYYGPDNPIWQNDPNPNSDWKNWDNTYAPPSEATTAWNNYLKGPLEDDDTYSAYTINGTVHNPYIPGFSSWRDNNDGYRSFDTGYSSGVDCSGFVQRCMDYNNNTYTAPSVNGRVVWGGGTTGLIGPGGFGSDIYTRVIDEVDFLVPGDFIHCDGHVGMVYKIVYGESRSVDANNVYIIESTGARWRVRIDRKLKEWEGDLNGWFPNISYRRGRVE